MENTAQQAYQQWLTSDAVDDASKQELEAIASDSKEIEERFTAIWRSAPPGCAVSSARVRIV